jgi:hypothetical protein
MLDFIRQFGANLATLYLYLSFSNSLRLSGLALAPVILFSFNILESLIFSYPNVSKNK